MQNTKAAHSKLRHIFKINKKILDGGVNRVVSNSKFIMKKSIEILKTKNQNRSKEEGKNQRRKPEELNLGQFNQSYYFFDNY